MNYTTIYSDEPNDRYIIFMYEKDRLCGINFHHGLGDLDTDYLKNDQRLMDIYLKRCKGAAQNVRHIEIAQDAIREFLVRYNEYEQNYHIERVAEITTEILLERFASNLYLDSVELENGHRQRLEAIQELMDNVMRDIYKFNTKDK